MNLKHYKAVNQIMDTYGKIDILVNNAGAINDPIHFHEMPNSEIQNLINVNLLGVFNMTKAVLTNDVRRQKWFNCKHWFNFK